MTILFLSIIIFGCNEEEFLNEQPIANVSVNMFFKTSSDFEQAVNGAYRGLHGLDNSFWLLSEMRSDASTHMWNIKDQARLNIFGFVDQFKLHSANEAIATPWRNGYSNIGRCNAVLHYIEDKEIDNKARYIGEIKFLRALNYFYLVMYYGDVPLVTKKIDIYEEAFEQNKRVSKDKVYELILSDLNYAKENLPQNYSGADIGRATEGAARTLLAKVLMWLDRYGDAASELEKVKKGSEYALLDEYSAVFDIDNENNEEIVFSVQHVEGPYGLGSDFMYSFVPWNSKTRYTPHMQREGAGGFNMPTVDLITSFEKGDKRKAMIDTSWIDHQYGFYHDSIVPFTRKFMDTEHSVPFVTGKNFPLFRYPHVLLMLAECYVREDGGDPVSLVNQVRDRAGLPLLSNVTLDDILHERMIEFHCEADRWDVLVRTGRAKEVMKAHGERENQRKYFKGRNSFETIKLLYPIPDFVLELDPTMEQNPEYQ